MSTEDRQMLRLLLAARLSQKKGKGPFQALGIETQDEYGRRWAERQHDFTTVHGTYKNVEVIATVADVKSGTVAPWDRKNLKPWVTRPELMQRYDGILAYKNDRLSRGAWEDETKIRQWASKNGKVLVIVDGPQWPPRDDGDFWSWTAMAKQANAELVETKERYARNRRALIERGALVGQVPTWAFTITGEEYEKQAIPTKLGEDYIPQIFQRIADGDSLATVAAWTREQGLGSGRMGARTIDRIIRNPIYRGHREFSFEGQIVTLRVEPLVDAKLWQQANDRLRNAPQGRRGPVTGRSALLTGCLFCPRCPRDGKYAPMYRLRAGRKPHGHYYYRCAGHYPERQGCGNMVDLDSTDIAVIHLLSMAQEPWKEQQLVKGENHDIELTEIRIALDDLPKRHLSDAEEDAERSRLRAERNRLESLPNIPDHWEEVDTGKTVGEHFVSLNREGRRAMLLEDVTVYAESITDPELRKVTSGPMLRIESRLFTLPVTWINEE